MTKVDDKKKENESSRKAPEAPPSAREEKSIEPVDFVRKDIRQGIHSCTINGKRTRLIDRQHYVARTKAEIDFFMADPEVIIFDGRPIRKKK